MWHVGLLYRTVDLLGLLLERPLSVTALLAELPNYRGVETKRLTEIAIRGKWVDKSGDGTLAVTGAGEDLLVMSTPVQRLRSQLKILIQRLAPAWAGTVIQGRKAFEQYVPPEVSQCFREAGILDTIEPEAICWWDELAARYRQTRNAVRVEVGRTGERLSYEYELDRTGKAPSWIALEYEGAGYDLISALSATCSEQLLIEVKTSKEPWDKAKFHITRHEWDVLSATQHAVIHLWSLATHLHDHAVVPVPDVRPHVPADQEAGRWEVAVAPFSLFAPGRKANES